MPGSFFFACNTVVFFSVFRLQHRIYREMLKPLNRIKLTSKALRNPAQTSRYSIRSCILYIFLHPD